MNADATQAWHVHVASQPATLSALTDGNDRDLAYRDIVEAFSQTLTARLYNHGATLFETDANDLWKTYLRAFPTHRRQSHNCHACRRFIEQFGHLATIDQWGDIVPAFWARHWPHGTEYADPFSKLYERVARAKIVRPWTTRLDVWGQPITGPWRHLHALRPQNFPAFTDRTREPHQWAAERVTGFASVRNALKTYAREHLDLAVAMLRERDDWKAANVIGPAEWLHTLACTLETASDNIRRDNLTWRAIYSAPEGFLHPRSTMIGTLLDDLAAGYTLERARERFDLKMNPTRYRRPTAAPENATIDKAERLIDALDARSSLFRRFALLSDIDPNRFLWKQSGEPAPGSVLLKRGPFSHLRQKQATEPSTSPRTMTWEKFLRTILPQCKQLQVRVPTSGPFSSLVTEGVPNSEPLLLWDLKSNRNPFSWYFWNRPPATAEQFGLTAGLWSTVLGVTLRPDLWTLIHRREAPGRGAFLVIEDAHESKNPGLCLFPAFMRSELHGIASVIERHSNEGRLELIPRSVAQASGLMLQEGATWDIELRAWIDGRPSHIRLDRWD